MPLDGALAVFEGRERGSRRLRAAPRRRTFLRPPLVTVDGFAAGERGGYVALALRGLGEVVAGRLPKPFELR